jgi:hypothetical protein
MNGIWRATKSLGHTLAVLGILAAWGCGNGGTPGADQGPRLDTGNGKPTDGGTGLKITITSPASGATDVSVTRPNLRATFSRPLSDPDSMKVVLVKDGNSFYGERKYSATNLEVTFFPFNILESRAAYTFRVSAEGAEAQVTFTTEKAHQGALPPAEGKTYDFRIKEVTYPKELGAVFNAQLQTAPPVLMHVVEVKDEGRQDGTNRGSITIAGSTGKPGEPAGQAKVLAEDATHTTTTSMALHGRLLGSWMGAGPSDLHLTASGIPLIIRDFYVTGLLTADGSKVESVVLTGVIDPVELGKAIGKDIDLSFICTDATFSKFCDEQKRIRVAASVETVANPIPFTTFITAPVNNGKDVPTSTEVQVYFSEEVDSSKTTVKVSADSSGAAVSGQMSFGKKALSFKPDAALAAASKYSVEVAGVAKGGATDTRHTTFTTK